MNKEIINSTFKLGILGGGQLGKMLSLAAQNWDLKIWILDAAKDFPAGTCCDHFIEGSFKNYDDVYQFGKQVDVLTLEIEHVNTEALIQLEKEGVIVHPSPSALNIIKDKGLQKQFYVKNNLPTAPFDLYAGPAEIKAAIESGALSFPFVQKSRLAGYDGKGVAVIKTTEDLGKLIDAPSMVEPFVNLDKEIAVQVARNPSGEIKTFPAVEMEFNPHANLVEYLISPANISEEIENKAAEIARSTIEAYNICGLLSVEFFLSPDGELLINEVAPRPHNSGHHTIEANHCSQFQQHIRAVLDWPLGDTSLISPSVMVNLLGHPDYTGQAIYKGLAACMKIKGANLHLYGKTMTKPYRKMGHATLLAESTEAAKAKANQIKEHLQIIA